MSLCIILDQFSFQLFKWITHFPPTQEDGKEKAWVFRRDCGRKLTSISKWTNMYGLVRSFDNFVNYLGFFPVGFGYTPDIHRFPAMHIVKTHFLWNICEYQSHPKKYWKKIQISIIENIHRSNCAVLFLVKCIGCLCKLPNCRRNHIQCWQILVIQYAKCYFDLWTVKNKKSQSLVFLHTFLSCISIQII